MSPQSFTDEETRFAIVESDSPVSVDGYALGEPKTLRCVECGAEVLLTPEPSRGIDELGHEGSCPQRWVRSRWWQRKFRSD